MSTRCADMSVHFNIDAGGVVPRSCWLYVLEWDDWAMDAPVTTLREYEVREDARIVLRSGPDEPREPSNLLTLPLVCNGGALRYSFLLTRARLDHELTELLRAEAAELLPAVDLTKLDPSERDPSIRRDDREVYWVRAVDPITDAMELATQYVRALNRETDFELHPGEHRWAPLAQALQSSILPHLHETDLDDEQQAGLRKKVEDTLRKAERERSRRRDDTERAARRLIDLLESSLWTRYVAAALQLERDPSQVQAYLTFWLGAIDRLAACAPGRLYLTCVIDHALEGTGNEADGDFVRDYVLPMREPDGVAAPILKGIAGSALFPLVLENLVAPLVWLKKAEAPAILQRALQHLFGEHVLEVSAKIVKLKPLQWLGDRWQRLDVEIVSTKLASLSVPAKGLEAVCTLLNLGMATVALKGALASGKRDEIMPSLMSVVASAMGAIGYGVSVRSVLTTTSADAAKVLTRRLGIVGAVFEAGSGMWSARVALKARDYDQATWRVVGAGASGITIWGLAVQGGAASAAVSGGTLLAVGVIVGVVAGIMVTLTQDDALTVFLKNCHLGPFGFGLPGVDAPPYTGVKTFGDPEWDSPKVQLQALFNLFGGMSVHHSGVSDARDLWVKFRMVTPESVLWIGWEYTKSGKTIRTPDQTIALADVELKGSQDGFASMLLKAPADVPPSATEHWVRLSLDVNGDESVYVPPPDRWMLVPIRSGGKDSTWSEKLNSWEH